jgi:hypothetical protein
MRRNKIEVHGDGITLRLPDSQNTPVFDAFLALPHAS